jgi:NADH:ubiquinone oxidoreductase subunit K
MNGQIFGLFIMIFMGALPCIILGYLVAVKQKRGLIAGWDESKIAHPEAYAKWIGYSVLVLGILIALIAIIWSIGLIGETVFAILLAIASMIPIPCLLIANAKYR